jgi:hypothetical protein
MVPASAFAPLSMLIFNGILEHEAQLFAAQITEYDINYIPRTQS